MRENDFEITIPNWISGKESRTSQLSRIEKYNPHSGLIDCFLENSGPGEVALAVIAAEKAFITWSKTNPVKRGQILAQFSALMKSKSSWLAECVARETAKPLQDAHGEVKGAIQLADFFSGEGMRLYARSLTSGVDGKFSHTIRQPCGIAGLIVPANTPIANIAWKVFPALICGNTAILKAAEEAPRIAYELAKISKEAEVPDGVFNVIQGTGELAGKSLVNNSRIGLISFTGSTDVGRWIAEVAGKRLARVSLELGGKNPFVVCNDADLDWATRWAALSAFSNAGQRCAAASRILVFESIYEEFKAKLVAKAKSLKLGVGPGCDLGPVITRRQRDYILDAVAKAKSDGATVLCGGSPPPDPELTGGFYIEPTLLEGLSPVCDMACRELFGPIATMHPVKDLEEAIEVANFSDYGLTAAIHTRNVDRAMNFAQRVRAGVANVNMGTFGSEPHMPFGGFGISGNGTREPGVEALDVYSELKNISFLTREVV
jgi:acyl-CoA reductase-like NAD-dependent aldehyde dehydrogenase